MRDPGTEPDTTGSTSTNAVRATGGALTTTISVSIPVFLVGGLAVQVGDELGFSPAGLGLVVSTYFGVSALASIPAGTLVERHGATRTARIALGLAATVLIGIAVGARSLWTLTAILALGAAANAMGQLASNTSLSRHVPVHRQGLTFGIKQAAIPVATVLAGAAVPALALTLGWRWAFVLAGLLAAATIPLVPREIAHRRHRPEPGRATGPLMVLGIASTLAAGSANALSTFVVSSAVERGIMPGPAGLVLTLGGAICGLARIYGGWQADLRPERQVSVIAALLVTGAAGLALLAVPGTPALVAGVVLGFGFGWAWPGLMNFAVVRLHPQAPAAATSITQTGVYAGGCIGPIGLGAIAHTAGYPAMWVTAAVAMLGAATLMLAGSRILSRSGRR
ncbi:MFS transporter [Actinoplanes sp. NEAU-A12]|uniref:MFS transporter n=1 Tax=Actinoplanes sandaracinus TaxID=3045177 RepID=A0ABT6WLM3_9ACTN|nr:MFS transporter [Actinoplanes sandaracinus]MDI6100615.1 MFS transporter [Actinoplanes sandaracinus]